MPLTEATALHREECHVLPSDDDADLTALAQLAEYCERFSPLVGWETVTPKDARCGARAGTAPSQGACVVGAPGHLFLDVTGIGILFGSEEGLAREAVNALARLGYDARAAIADTVGAAWALATAWEARGELPIILPSPGIEAGIGPLPVSALRLPSETVDLLAQLGVAQIGQLLKLPRASLTVRFGERLLLRLDQLLGTAQETISAYRPPPEFVVERLLEHPAESRELIERIVHELVERIAPILAQHRKGAVRLSCRLDCAPGRPLVWKVGLFRPSADPEHLWNLSRIQLERQALPGPVGRVTLAVPWTAPLQDRQLDLFADNRQQAFRQFELLIDRLGSRLGPEAVLRPELTADPLPERAVRYVPLLHGKSKRRESQANAPSALQRPLLLRSPPLALEVISIVPDGPPLSFRLGGRIHRVSRWWGPERIESGWWRGRSVRRDYYRVEADSGQRHWLFRQLQNGKWYLQGEFA